MKNTINAQQWACDVVTDTFDQDFLDQLCLLTNSDILLVPRRLKGITSGENGRCYWNANICAQTWGGTVWYGWGISFIGGNINAGIDLYGHACWLTPEGKLVDPTYCQGINESYFIPYTDKLILNGKITESICDLCYPKSTKDLDVLMCRVASQYGARVEDIKDQGYYQGIGINHDRYLNKIVYYDALPHDLVVQVMEGMDPLSQRKIHVMFSPCVKPIDQGAPKKLIHDPTLTLAEIQKRFNAEQKPMCSLYAGYDVTAQWMGKDMVWDSVNFKKPPLVNKSLKTGRLIPPGFRKDVTPLVSTPGGLRT